ncbi:MAG: hypothetical protein FWE09_01335 [Treponema sp.]|nr:hypothetical protein [Treponema sp.]
MAEMTEEEADVLDDLWTKTTPRIKVGSGGGYFRERQAHMLILDGQTARVLNAKAQAARQTPAELVAALLRREIGAISG